MTPEKLDELEQYAKDQLKLGWWMAQELLDLIAHIRRLQRDLAEAYQG